MSFKIFKFQCESDPKKTILLKRDSENFWLGKFGGLEDSDIVNVWYEVHIPGRYPPKGYKNSIEEYNETERIYCRDSFADGYECLNFIIPCKEKDSEKNLKLKLRLDINKKIMIMESDLNEYTNEDVFIRCE